MKRIASAVSRAVLVAALVRVLYPLVTPGAAVGALTLAASAWSLAFALYLFQYGPWLLRTRADGKDG